MSKIKKIGLAGVVLAIVFVVAFICFNRKEKNKIEEKETKKNECAEMQLFEYPTQYSQVSGNHYFYLLFSIYIHYNACNCNKQYKKDCIHYFPPKIGVREPAYTSPLTLIIS